MASISFTTTSGYKGSWNDGQDAKGWALGFTIPFTSLGLSAPPAQGTTWGLGVVVHDRDAQARALRFGDKVWPENMDGNRPSSWGQLRFGLPTYTPPAASRAQSVTIRHKLNGVVVKDGMVGGSSTCGGDPAQYWTQWGETNYAGATTVNVQNQSDISDWPCFSKYYVTFPLDAVPSDKVIISATLTLHQMGNSGPVSNGQPPPASLIQVMTVAEDWNETALTWNNAPFAMENVSRAWVQPIEGCGAPGGIPWPCVPRTWECEAWLWRKPTQQELRRVSCSTQPIVTIALGSTLRLPIPATGMRKGVLHSRCFGVIRSSTIPIRLGLSLRSEGVNLINRKRIKWIFFFCLMVGIAVSSSAATSIPSLNTTRTAAAIGEATAVIPGEWTQLGHDPQRTGYVPTEVPGPWQLKWIWNGPAGGGDAGPASDHLKLPKAVQPVAGGGRLYIGHSDGVVRAISDATGQQVWASPSLGGAISNTAAFDAETNSVYVGTSDGRFWRLNADDGQVIRSNRPGGQVLMAPLVVGNAVYIGSTDGTFYAFDKSSLSQIWSYDAGAALIASPAYSANHGGSDHPSGRGQVRACHPRRRWNPAMAGHGERRCGSQTRHRVRRHILPGRV